MHDDTRIALDTARALLDTLTPLRQDCGALCGAACCQPDAEADSGMYLFPGEAALYATADWARVLPTRWVVDGAPVPLLVCEGRCPRDQRPLSCRLFPLAPRIQNGVLTLRMDPRARPVCPLCSSGMRGLSPAFVAAAESALTALFAAPEHRAFLAALDALLRQYTL